MELTADPKAKPHKSAESRRANPTTPEPFAGPDSPKASCMDFIADLKARLHRIEFKPQAGPGEDVLLEFSEPAPSKAVSSSMAVETLADGPGSSSYDVSGLVRAARRQGRIALAQGPAVIDGIDGDRPSGPDHHGQG